MDLGKYINDQTQVVEFYICPKHVDLEKDDVIDCGWKKYNQNIPLGNGHKMKLKDYHHRDMCYTYDMENDGQRVVRKIMQMEDTTKNLYIAAYEEDVLPVHRFPCVQEITHETQYERTSYRINSRTYLYHDREDGWEYVYIRYQHAPNVDTKQMQADIHRVLRKLGVYV